MSQPYSRSTDMTSLSPAERIQRLLSRPINKLRTFFSPQIWRWIWRGITLLSLSAIVIGAVYTYRTFPDESIRIDPAFIGLAFGIYIATFVMHLMGWRGLSRIFFKHIPLHDDIEAVAASNLVKYLPTIAWYIANRTHYYKQRQIPPTTVVTASLYELAFMVGASAAFFLISWLHNINMVLTVIAIGAIPLALWLVAKRFPFTQNVDASDSRYSWITTFLWYAASWPLGGLFLWAILRSFAPISIGDLPIVFHIWLLSSLASYAVSLTLGTLGIAREITLSVLLAPIWPLPAALATAITVKLLLTLGEVICSLLVLGFLRLTKSEEGSS